MTKDERAALKAAIDARRRCLVADDLPPQGDHGTDRAYRGGCRCRVCLDMQTSRRRAYRHAHPERERAWHQSYKPRRTALRKARLAAQRGES